MVDKNKNNNLQNEAFDAYCRIKPIMEEYFDSWIVMANRAGCKTKIVLADIERSADDMKLQLARTKAWKCSPVIRRRRDNIGEEQ